jgi:Protein of unknown function (DUF1592)/Protein of unknown function (DUF1588)/Protein of unknown function (DUF1595)
MPQPTTRIFGQALVAALALSGCYGFSEDSGDKTRSSPTGTSGTTGSASSPAGVVCDPALKPPMARLRRLTSTQYKHTLADVVAWALGDETASATVLSATTALATLPDDEPEKNTEDTKGSYRRLDQSLQAARVDAYYQIGIDLGHALTKNTNLAKLAGRCATDADSSNDAACIEAFIRKFGARILRRPIAGTDVAFYKGVYGTGTVQDPDAYADVLGVMFNAPEFLYFVEHGTTAVAGDPDNLRLGPHELAARLSYQLWDTMPDDALFAAATDGSILTEAGYQKQVERLLADPRTKLTTEAFFRDWVKASEFPELDLRNGDPLFKAFAAANLPSKTLRAAMIRDALDTVDRVVWDNKGSLKTLFSTQMNVNKDPELAKIYGVPAWDGRGAPPEFAGDRPGLFTRAMFLTTGSASTRPIIKGVFLRRQILCDVIPPPPPNVNLTPPDLKPDFTTREVVEEVTQKPGSACAGCHQYTINPLGFAFEGFDSLARPRTAQTLFDANGTVFGSKPIRTDSIPGVNLGDPRPSAGPADLMAQIAANPKTGVCFARNYFRFTSGRWETKGDGCAIKHYDDALEAGSIADVLKAAVLDPQFKQRVFDSKK